MNGNAMIINGSCEVNNIPLSPLVLVPEQTGPLNLQQNMSPPKPSKSVMKLSPMPNANIFSSYKETISPPRAVLSPPESMLSPPLSTGSNTPPPMRHPQMPLSPSSESQHGPLFITNNHHIPHNVQASMLQKLQQSKYTNRLDIKCETDSRKSVIETNNKVPIQCS